MSHSFHRSDDLASCAESLQAEGWIVINPDDAEDIKLGIKQAYVDLVKLLGDDVSKEDREWFDGTLQSTFEMWSDLEDREQKRATEDEADQFRINPRG